MLKFSIQIQPISLQIFFLIAIVAGSQVPLPRHAESIPQGHVQLRKNQSNLRAGREGRRRQVQHAVGPLLEWQAAAADAESAR